MGKEAILETYTHAPQRPVAFNQYELYTIAVARTEDGVHVMGLLEDVESEDVKVGMKLVMNTNKLPDGFLVITLSLTAHIEFGSQMLLIHE